MRARGELKFDRLLALEWMQVDPHRMDKDETRPTTGPALAAAILAVEICLLLLARHPAPLSADFASKFQLFSHWLRPGIHY